MVNPQFAQRLREKAASLPLSPGVYIMRDTGGHVIYVGKSRSIKSRVSQYFHDNDFKSAKTDVMTGLVCDFEYILCDTEMEALTLENSLIKLYHPRYNIKLRDDKSYPYLKATIYEDYPRFLMTRRRDDSKAKYFGPYTSTNTVYGIISSMQKTFGIPSCKHIFPHDIGRVHNCIYREIGCIAPCDEAVTKEKFKETFMQAVSFLSGDSKELIDSLAEKMNYASENLLFEAAAVYRDRISSVKKLSEKQKVVADPDIERDIIAFYSGDPVSSACIFYVRHGMLVDSENFFFSGNEIIDSAAMCSFICELYNMREYIPREIAVSGGMTDEDTSLACDWLSEKVSYRVTLRVPQRGELRRLLEMAQENAEQKAKEYKINSERSEKSLAKLASIAGLEIIPERIEAFDISNYKDENITAGMVVFEDAKPKKSDYRIFKIKSNSQDDYGAMREAVSRRLSHLTDEGAKKPDLILVDGGLAHVSVISEVLASSGYDIPVLGMVKDEHHKTRALVGIDGEISIAGEQQVYTLIYKIQEEVHRFTVSRMTGAKRKNERTSILEKIDGIGAAKAKTLLGKFGGLRGVRTASKDDLCSVRGINEDLADKIISYFNNNEVKD